MTLNDALEYVDVDPPGLWENPLVELIPDWWGVSTNDAGIIAYFQNERDACAFRLMLINMILNGPNPEGKS